MTILEQYAKARIEYLDALHAIPLTDTDAREFFLRKIEYVDAQIARVAKWDAPWMATAWDAWLDSVETRTDEQRDAAAERDLAIDAKIREINAGLSEDTVELPFDDRMFRPTHGACVDWHTVQAVPKGR